MFSEYNYKNTVKDGINTDDMPFAPLKQFVGDILHVDGFFFTSGKYGEQVVVIANGYKINFPKRATDVFKKISENEEQLDAVLTGHLAIGDIKIVETRNGTTTVYKMTDC